MSERIYVVNARRTPVCKSRGEKIPPEEGGNGLDRYPGKYESMGSVELLSCVMKDLVQNTNIPKNDIADIITGCAIQDSDQGANVARIAQLTLDLPLEIPAVSVDRLCGSSLTATMKAAEFLIAGQNFKNERPGAVLVSGIEHMGHHDMATIFTPSQYFYDEFAKDNTTALSMGLTAEKLAEMYQVSRKEQEVFAYQSHTKAVKAASDGRFDEEIIPVTLPNGEVLKQDVGPRAYASLDDALFQFNRLKPAFKNGGTVTAATSAPYSDGASGLFVVTESYMKQRRLKPMAEIIAWASVGVDPNIMGFGPVVSTRMVLKRAGLDIKDIGLIEMNEAFCAQSLACIKQLCKDFNLNEEEFKTIINVNGGATALGHPLGATGAKLATTMVHELQRRPEVEYGLVTMCIGMGQGDAMIFRNVH